MQPPVIHTVSHHGYVRVVFNSCTEALIWPASRYLETRFSPYPSEHKVPAAPNFDPDTLNRAASLGYSGPDATWLMSLEHELLHTWLSLRMGQSCSPTLHTVATKQPPLPRVFHCEEQLVFAFTRYLHGQPIEWPYLQFVVWAANARLSDLHAEARQFLDSLASAIRTLEAMAA